MLFTGTMHGKKAEFSVEVESWEAEMLVDVALGNDEWQWLTLFLSSFLLLVSAIKVSVSFPLIEYLSRSSEYKSAIVRQLCPGFHFFYVSLQASFN